MNSAWLLIRAFSRRGPVSMLVLAARCNLVAYPDDPVVIGEWLAHALSRVICWNVLHAVAGGDLAKQQSNPWGHGGFLILSF